LAAYNIIHGMKKNRYIIYALINFLFWLGLTVAVYLYVHETAGYSATAELAVGIIIAVGVSLALISSSFISIMMRRTLRSQQKTTQQAESLVKANEELHRQVEQLQESVFQKLISIREAEIRYAQLFDATGDLIIMADAVGNVSEMNRAARNFFTLVSESVTGVPLIKFFHTSNTARVGKIIEDVRQGEYFNEVLQLVDSEEKPRSVIAEFVPQFSGNAISGFRVSLRDVTAEVKQSQEKDLLLNISHAVNMAGTMDEVFAACGKRLKTFFSPCEIYIYTYNKTFNVLTLATTTEVNPQRINLQQTRQLVRDGELGLASRTASTRKEIFVPNIVKSPLIKNYLSATKAKHENSLASLPMMVGNNLYGVFQLVTSAPRTLQENDLQILRIVANEVAVAASRISLVEEIAVSNQSLKEKNEELETFVHTASHDLKSPLISIQGYATTMGEKYYESLSDDARFFLDRIRYNATQMENLIRELLELSRVGRENVTFESLHIYDVVLNIKEIFAAQIKTKGIQLVVDQDAAELFYPKRRFEQALTNLVGNAIKYMEKTDNPKVEVRQIERKDHYEIVVKDNGVGIDEKNFEKIFKVFSRVATDSQGSGLGLAIVRRIVEQYGGKIWVVSELGQGSEFHFTVLKKPSQFMETEPFTLMSGEV
jgi:PAS domain S-box-containing protein